MTHDTSFAPTPNRKQSFFWFVIICGAVFVGLYVFSAWMIVRYGTIRKDLGWEGTNHGSEWYISYVFPDGPAANTLKQGDRILALNGDPRVGRIGPVFKLRDILSQTAYTIRISRGSDELEFALSIPTTRSFHQLWELFPSMPVSIAFFVVGLLVGVLKPNERFAQLGSLALMGAALGVLNETLLPIGLFFHGSERLLAFPIGSIVPLQYVLAYHFYYRFPPEVPQSRFWGGLKYFIYVTGGVTFLWSNSVRLLSFRSGDLTILSNYPELMDIYILLRNSFEMIAVIAIFAVIVRNYLKVKQPDQRRRSRLMLYGSVSAFSVILLSILTWNIGYLNPFGLANTTLDWASNIALILIPVSTGYAILKHKMFDINVVIRRTLQYVLAKNALQVILSLPLLGLIVTLALNPNRTLAEILFRNSVYFYVLSFIAVAISLKFRKQLRLWIDRKFFREAYDREKSLMNLIEVVKDLDSLPEISKVVSGEVDAALHPKSIYLFYREEGRPECDAEVENNTTHYVEDKLPQKAKWARVICSFPNIMGSMKEKPSMFPGQVGNIHILAEDPGEYEVKILRENKLARSLKFTVAPGGSFDNGIAKNSKLGSDRVIVPVQIIGDQDGVWERNAWRDAFYGNPLTGFTAFP